jgi:PAS domain S-box-containing protein
MTERPPRYASLLSDLDLAGFRAIAAVLREGVVLLDRDLRVRDLNVAAERILGRPASELVGQQACSLFGEGDCPRDTLADSLTSERPILDFQTTVHLPGGRRGHVVLSSAPLISPRRDADGVALIIGDVTEETRLRRQTVQRDRLGGLVGSDRRMRQLYDLIAQVAPSEATVLIRGESGTGKELVARALHARSARADGPFVSVNCSALAETLLESELFGHVRGAFTGATADRRGRFEQARGGTLFLDEIGDVSPTVQVKLLRVLQERTVERVGDSRPIPVDVRVVSATNRDLEALLAGGQLREDFYYRIKVVRLDIPPLRERREDIPPLAIDLLARHGAPGVALSPGALSRLMNHAWPGNVRELENALQHALVLRGDGPIQPEHLPPEIGTGSGAGETGAEAGAAGHSDPLADPRAALRAVERGSEDERDLLARTLESVGWNRTRAARRLGIDRTTLWRKLREHRLRAPH